MAGKTGQEQELNLLSPQQALVCVMLMVAAADGNLQPSEEDRIERLLLSLPVFSGFDNNALQQVIGNFAEIMSADDGLDCMLSLVAAALPAQLTETAYALGVEMAAADLTIQPEEIRLLEMIRDHLHVDKLMAAAIERGARARFASLPAGNK